MRTLITQKTLIFFLVIFSQFGAFSQVPDRLDRYVQQAFANNIVLQQKTTDVDLALNALKSAQALFLPNLSFQAGYQTGEGGRSITIPVGDLMNPVYSTLNQLTGTSKFPQIANSTTNFLPSHFTDVKVMTTVPVYNSDLIYNKKIRNQELELKQTEVKAYQRELVKQLKTAYYNYLSARTAITIYESALQLAEEGKRTNQKLIENGKGLPAYLLRAESEVENVKALLNDAQKQEENARRYFNFLLNADIDSPIDTGIDMQAALQTATAPLANESYKREELVMLRQSLGIQETALSMNRDFRLPKVNAFLQTGVQAERFKFNNNAAYYLAGVQLEIPLFQGQSNLLRIRRSELNVKQAQRELEQITQQLSFTTSVARNNLQSSLTLYQSARKRAEAAAAYQRLIEKGYKEGVNSFIETVDARNQLTQAELNANSQRYRILIAAASLERETGSYTLPESIVKAQ